MKERTIEVLSSHPGPHKMRLRNDETRTVEFEDRGEVSIAMVDEDEAQHLLGEIGKPHYWKAEAIEIPAEEKNEDPGGDDEVKELTIENYDKLVNANALKKLLKTCTNRTLIMELVAIELQREPARETWSNALNGRLAELAE
jgi:hypothetical protein